jgi:CheY-like chemotaxis protein
MFKKEALYSVPELKIAGRVNLSDDTHVSRFLAVLNQFVDNVAIQSNSLLREMNAKAYASVAQRLTDLKKQLDAIHAENLSKECGKLADTLHTGKVANADEAEAALEYFIQAASALSIDIQMAIHRGNMNVKRETTRSGNAKQLIVAVDNALMYLNTLKKLLANTPYDLYATTSCQEALDFIKNNRPDLFLLDIEMPEMDGYELARKIKQTGQNAPVIFITANSEREFVDRAVKEGAAGLLVKPLRANQLIAKVEECI